MSFTIPDNDEAFNTNQAIWMQTDINALVAALAGDGVLSGCAVSEDAGGASMDLDITAGSVQISGGTYAVTGGAAAATVSAADATDPRIDLVSVDNADTITVTAGTAAASPKAPDIPAGDVLLAMVYIPATDTTIADNQITDKRVILPTRRGEIFIPAAAMWPSTTSGAAAPTKTEYTTNDQDLYGIAFDKDSDEYAQFTIWMPDDWNAGTITFLASWTAASGSGDVIWGLQGVSYANSDAIDVAWGTAQTSTDTLLTANDVHYSPESSAITLAGTPAAGEVVQFRVYRDADAGGDTLSVDAILLGLKVYYVRS